MQIQLPPRFVAVPAVVIYSDQVSSSDKELFLRILGLAWENNYKRTPNLPLPDLLRFLGISHATFYRITGKLARVSWLLSSTPRPGCVRFTFPVVLSDGTIDDQASLKLETRVSNLRLPPEEDDEEDSLINLKDPPPPPPQSLKLETVSKMRLLQSAGVKPEIASKIELDPGTGLEDILANIAYAHDPRNGARLPAVILGINLLNGYRPDATYYGDPGRIPPAILERAGLASLLEPDDPDSSDGAEPDPPADEPDPSPAEPGNPPDPSIDLVITGSITARAAWQAASGQLKMELSGGAFNTWVRQVELITYEDGIFVLGAPNAYAREWLESRLASTINRLLTGMINKSCIVKFVVCQDE